MPDHYAIVRSTRARFFVHELNLFFLHMMRQLKRSTIILCEAIRCMRISIMQKIILIWDNDGTIQGSLNPNDTSSSAKVILPNVQRIMESNDIVNIICSGCKTTESESQNFDPLLVIERFKILMNKLPIRLATFSPAIGGTQCYVLIKHMLNDDFEIRKAHEDQRYHHLIGQFKKPGTGMLTVIQDLLHELRHAHESTKLFFIGDTWHDEYAAATVGIPFIAAQKVHLLPENVLVDTLLIFDT